MPIYVGNHKISPFGISVQNTGNGATIINKSDLVIYGATSFDVGDSLGHSISDSGKLRIKAGNKFYFFNVPPLGSVDTNVCDTLNNLKLIQKVSNISLCDDLQWGYKDSYTTSTINNGEFYISAKYVNAKTGAKIKYNSNYISNVAASHFGITFKIDLSFFGEDPVPTTIAEFKSYMKENENKNIKIYYELDNPIEIELDDEYIVIDNCKEYEIIDPLKKVSITVNSNSSTLEKETYLSKQLLADNKRTYFASEFGCSYSDIASICSGDIDTNKIIVEDLYYLDFEVGQGIAIENACYVREDELSWLCAEIVDINYDTNTITISRNLQAAVNNVKIEHDNFIPYLKITDYFVDKDFVDLKFEPGTYLNHALRSGQNINKLKTILSEHNLGRPEAGDDRCMIIIEDKRFVNIDFQGSVFKEVAKWKLKADENFGGKRCNVLPYSFIQLWGCDKTVMKNGKVDHDSENNCIDTGVRTAENMGNGFCVHGCLDVLLENLEAYGCESDGFALGGSSTNFYYNSGRGNKNIFIKNCRAYYCGRQGLTFSSGTDGVIDNCEFSYTGFCKDGVTKCWWGNRNPGAGIDFEFESASDLTTGWAATSAIRRIRVTNTKLIGNSYTIANGMTEGNFLMENCVLIGNPNGVFLIKTGANAGFVQREEEDEPESYDFGKMQPITCTIRDCLIDANGVPNMSTFGMFKRVVIDNCVLRNFFYAYGGRQFSIIDSDLQYTDGKASHMQGYTRFPLIQNCTVRFRKEFIDKFTEWNKSPIYGQFQDCTFYLEEPTVELAEGRTLILDFGPNSQRNYVYPAIAYDFSGSTTNGIIKKHTVDWGNRKCFEVYSAKETIANKILKTDKIITSNSFSIEKDPLKTNYIINEDFKLTDSTGKITVTIRALELDYYITFSPNRTNNIRSIYFNLWTNKDFVFTNGATNYTYTIPESLNGRAFTLHVIQDEFNELLIDIKLITSANSIFDTVIVPTYINFNTTSKFLNLGDTLQLNAKVTPADESLNYVSNTQSVATVSNKGLVETLSTGTSTITVSNSNGTVSKSCIIIVGNFDEELADDANLMDNAVYLNNYRYNGINEDGSPTEQKLNGNTIIAIGVAANQTYNISNLGSDLKKIFFWSQGTYLSSGSNSYGYSKFTTPENCNIVTFSLVKTEADIKALNIAITKEL